MYIWHVKIAIEIVVLIHTIKNYTNKLCFVILFIIRKKNTKQLLYTKLINNIKKNTHNIKTVQNILYIKTVETYCVYKDCIIMSRHIT